MKPNRATEVSDSRQLLRQFLLEIYEAPRLPRSFESTPRLFSPQKSLRKTFRGFRKFPLHQRWVPKDSKQQLTDKLDELALRSNDLAGQASLMTIDAALNQYQISELAWGKIQKNEHYFHPKINHGFWEKLLVASSTIHVPKLHSYSKDRVFHRERLLHSRFFFALRAASTSSSQLANEPVRIDFGFSFGNGSISHAELLRSGTSEAGKKRILGTWAGSKLLFDSESAIPPNIVDGGAVKQALISGTLGKELHRLAADADSVAFIVPDSFPDLFLKSVDPAKQHTVRISGQHAAPRWPRVLCVSEPLLERVIAGERVLVLAQGGVAASLLGLYLAYAVGRLNPAGVLQFLDVGQALDHGVPQNKRGEWVGKSDYPVHKPVFESKTAATSNFNNRFFF